MLKLTMQLVCDKCGIAFGDAIEFDDDDTDVSRFLAGKKREARNIGWEVVRLKNNALKDWCPTCLEKHFAETQQ
jgi:hypothetical protein